MAKVAAVLTVFCLTVCAGFLSNTEATTTREITGGDVNSVGGPGPFDVLFDFLGSGFRVHGGDLNNVYLGGSSFSMRIVFPIGNPPAQITVDGDTCFPSGFDSLTTCSGTLVFTIDPAPGSMGTAPFTAAGHINVGDGFDIVGHGFVTTGPSPLGPGLNAAQFTFLAPEPSPLWLVSAGTLLAVSAFRRRRR